MCETSAFEDRFFDQRRGRGWFLGDDAVFAEDVVPGRGLVGFEKGVKTEYHSVSAFGSSIGTDIRSSFGAAIFVCCVVEE
jgi:hypothetical protein